MKGDSTFQELDCTASASQVDLALHFLRHGDRTVEAYSPLTENEEKQLVRKIDWMLLPLMAATYNLQYLDKTILNYANVMGLAKDTHTSASEFSYLATAFYVSYLFCEIPHGYLVQKLPVAKYLGACIVLWGICVVLNCVSTNYAALVALRVLLGCFESVLAPRYEDFPLPPSDGAETLINSLILITAMWYKKKEQPMRVGIWFGTGGIAIIVGSLFSFGLQYYEEKTFKSWQIMYLICGLVTIAVGILVILLVPDNPMSSRLSAREKYHAIERVRSNKTGIENKVFNLAQMIEAFRDPHVWLIVILMITASEINGALSNYQAALIKSFGFTSKQSALLSIPSGIIAIITCLSSSWIAGRTNQRLLTLMCFFPFGITGASLMAFLPPSQKAAKMVGNYFTNMVPTTPLMYTIAAANFSGHTKKITVNALVLM
ncbi:hypothetical protein EG329_005431 [Mollisiaceae sp. DMI_Dod_QoI]|nr:hypothetical protein EG329_005431 [Helotiales sp. DMI_Dod_QoI]